MPVTAKHMAYTPNTSRFWAKVSVPDTGGIQCRVCKRDVQRRRRREG